MFINAVFGNYLTEILSGWKFCCDFKKIVGEILGKQGIAKYMVGKSGDSFCEKQSGTISCGHTYIYVSF